MGMDVLEINTPSELVLWLHLTESNVSMAQAGSRKVRKCRQKSNRRKADRKG